MALDQEGLAENADSGAEPGVQAAPRLPRLGTSQPPQPPLQPGVTMAPTSRGGQEGQGGLPRETCS